MALNYTPGPFPGLRKGLCQIAEAGPKYQFSWLSLPAAGVASLRDCTWLRNFLTRAFASPG